MKKSILTAILLLLPSAAFAHPAPYLHVHGFAAGMMHPFTGLDHLLAMLSVGLWASQKGGRALWLWPAAFVSAMILGGVAGMEGFALPGIEPAIAASLLVLGLLIATVTTMPLAFGAALIALFGLFHGNAHGLEAPLDASGLAYGAGFVLATATLHAAGLALGLTARRAPAQWTLRAGAAVIALTGAAMVLT